MEKYFQLTHHIVFSQEQVIYFEQLKLYLHIPLVLELYIFHYFLRFVVLYNHLELYQLELYLLQYRNQKRDYNQREELEY